MKMMPNEALRAYARDLNPEESNRRAKDLRRVWHRSKPIDVFEVSMVSCARAISRIATRVYPSIQHLARCRAPLKNRDDCAKHRMFAHQRMLAAFGQCTGTPNFVFDLSGAQDAATKATEWMCLYSSAIRCSMGKCTKGFVFIDWMLSPDRPQTTLLWFDVVNGTQLLIDPSGTADVFHNMFSKNQPSWDPTGPIKHTKIFNVKDIAALKKCLEQEPAHFHCDDATFLVLIAWTCLRFGYEDIEQVTSAILCALCEHMKQAPKNFREFWDFMVVWRNELRLHDLTHDDLLYLLGLKVVKHNQPCGYMDNGTACIGHGHQDNVLCPKHMPKHNTKTQTIETLLKVPMSPLPENVARVACQPTHLQATAYFEDRWQETKWQCSWDMFRRQKKQIDVNHKRCNRIGCVRFVSVKGGESTGNWMKEILMKFAEDKEMQSSIEAFGVLNVDFLSDGHRHYAVDMVLQQVPVHPWSAMVVAIQSVAVFVSLNLATYSNVNEFKTTINGFLTTSPVSFHLRIGTNVETTQGLVCNRPLSTVCSGLCRC